MKRWVVCTCVLLALALSKQIYCKAVDVEDVHTVIVLFESVPGKETEFKKALLTIAEKSRAEASCLEYHIYQDACTPTKFALFEKWKSHELHLQQFSKPYILEFAKQATPLLAKPYQAVLGVEVDPPNP